MSLIAEIVNGLIDKGFDYIGLKPDGKMQVLKAADVPQGKCDTYAELTERNLEYYISQGYYW